MANKAKTKDRGLLASFYLSEVVAIAFGAPFAALYGFFLLDLKGLESMRFLLVVIAVTAASLICLALPMNIILGRKTARLLSYFRSGDADEESRTAIHGFIVRLPLVQAGYVLLRTSAASVAVLATIRSCAAAPFHMAASVTFAVYCALLTAVIVFYALHEKSSAIAQEIVETFTPENPRFSQDHSRAFTTGLSAVPVLAPILVASLGIFFLVMALAAEPSKARVYVTRISIVLGLNVAISVGLMAAVQFFRQMRLTSIVKALDDLVVRGDTSKRIPTDLEDYYAWTAHHINRALDVFGIVLGKLESASSRLAGTVMSFSSQIGQTVSAMSHQSQGVKEMIGTMEESGGVNEQISDRAEELSNGSRESQAFVDNGFGRVQDTIRKMDEIKTSNIQTLAEIGGLAEQISSIGDIIDIINNIANQTRIIAFNAELEASSAGAAGTSFRIVAEEIRRLANNTVEALVGIKGRISDIQQSSERLIGSSEEGTAKIDEGIQISAGLNDIFMNIRISAENTAVSAEGITAVLKEQTSSYDRVFTTIKQISEGSEQALAASRISGAEVEKLRILLDELKSLLSKFDFDTEHAVFNFTRS